LLSNLLVFQKTYDFALWVKPTTERFARVHRYGLGVELEGAVFGLLRAVARANVRKDKAAAVEDCLVEFEVVKVFVRMAKDYHLLSITQYGFAAERLDEIGRLLSGWQKKSVQVSSSGK
jgi:hypothetical protein